MASKKNKAKKGALSVDFTGVEVSGKHPEGRFNFTVDGAPELRNSETSGNDYLSFKLKSEKGTVYYIASLASHALWNLKNFLECAGQEVPDGEMQLDLEEMDGLEIGAEIIHEKYEGKTRSVVGEIFPCGEDSSNEEEEEEEGEVTYDSVQEMDLDELKELAKANDIKLAKKLLKDLDALRDHLCEELELEEGEEEEEEGEEPTYESVQEMDADELDELCEEHDIKVKAKDKKKLAAYRDAVCTALELEEGEEEEEEEKKPKGKKK